MTAHGSAAPLGRVPFLRGDRWFSLRFHHRLISVSPPGWLRTAAQLMAGVAIERPCGDGSTDKTFKKTPKAKAKGGAHRELEL